MPRFVKTTCEPVLIKSDVEAVDNFDKFSQSILRLFPGLIDPEVAKELTDDVQLLSKAMHECTDKKE